MTTILTIQNAGLTYQHKKIFANVNLTIEKSKWVALLGPSGVGKTSLLKMIAGLLSKDEQTEGNIQHHPAVIQQIAYMAQQDLLLPWYTVLQNTLLACKLRQLKSHALIREKEKEKALSLLKAVGLSDALHLYPQQLSGGMRQRVALARTLMTNKNILLMDEPFSALDAVTRYKLQNLATQLCHDKTVLFITHDPSEALRLAHDIYLLQGNPAKLRHVVKLNSPLPRAISDPAIVSLQEKLLLQLASDNP